MKRIIIIILIFFTGITARSQIDISDSCAFVPMFSAFYSMQLPGGDLADRFGMNSVIGGDFKIKTTKNWVYGVDYNFIFGSNIKNYDSILSRITTHNGQIIDGDGAYAKYQLFERGFYTTLTIGKIFPVIGPNPNSGIIIMGGPGYMQHKIRIDVENNTAPQLKDDYKRGYDHLRGGFTFAEFIGYLHMSNSKIINFYAGFEIVQAWTKDYRKYNFNEMKYTDNKYFDLLFGIKVGWFIPLHKKAPKTFYYN